jgi:tetratricopeptide (TPR) repeat protein
MARTFDARYWWRVRARSLASRLGAGRAGWFAVAFVVLISPGFASAEPIKGDATFSASGGFARLLIKFTEDVVTEVTTAGSIVVIRFERPVDLPVDKLSETVPDYVGSARRDPDGMAIRLSLARRVSINTMTAGERVFVDFLPDSWSGPPPGLPQDVVRELAERARIAERELRQQRMLAEASKRPPVKVHASVQPTFVRFVFELPDGVGISSVLNEQKLKLLFGKVLAFDLTDAKLAAPPSVASINQKTEGETSTVEIALVGDVDVHSFREDKNYVVDVAFQQAEKTSPLPSVADALHAPMRAAETRAPPLPAPSSPAMPAAPAAPVTAPATSEKASAMTSTPPQASEALPTMPAARQTRPEVNPEQAPKMPAASEPPMSAPASKEPPAGAAEAGPKMSPPPPAPAQDLKPVGANSPVGSSRDSDGLHLTFSFPAATPAALFRRADTLWLVLDSRMPIDIEPLRSQVGGVMSDVGVVALEQGLAVRIRLSRPQLPSLTGEEVASGMVWTLTFADIMQAPTQPLAAIRNIAEPSLANVTVPLPKAGLLHRFVDPEAGDTLLVVTAMPPAHGLVKRQDFVELSLLESIHGVAIRPNSDDVTASIASDKIVLGKPGGLTLSPADTGAERAPTAVRPIFDLGEWRRNQQGSFIERQDALIAAAGAAAPDQRGRARVDLARFYMSRGLFAEAASVVDLALADSKSGSEDPAALIVHCVANILMGRPERGLKDLANPGIGANYDSQLWKAMASARTGKWPDAREKFKSIEFAISSLPIELQRIVLVDAMRASIEVKDYPSAAKRASELDVIGSSNELKPAISVLRGRLAEGLGHEKDALDEYRSAIESADRISATEAKLLEIALLQKRGEIGQADTLRELETLGVTWRGDALEVQTLEMLARIYADSGRYAESFAAVRIANRLSPNLEIARQGQDAASALFAQLFLGQKGDDLPPIDALGMFYDYRELTPIGRRGDEMIRRLADRLVAVDLLDQAAELLQYQIDKRLEGAARAQVAARLAMVYLTNRKPDRAITALRSTRIVDLSGELRQQRLLLEARAQSDVGRHDLALDIVSSLSGREAIRLRSDIHWAARQWREAAEQIELYYADRWRDFKPLNPAEKSDMIRAVVGYALAEDTIGLERFREKYGPLMSSEADRAVFETASKPVGSSSADLAQIAKMAASVDTLEGFLREMRTRFPDASARANMPGGTVKADPPTTGSLPAIVGVKQAAAAK